MSVFIDRASEPSTWAGLAATALALGVGSEGQIQTISTAVAGIFGVIAMLTKEKGPA